MAERGFEHLVHALIVGAIAFVIMRNMMKMSVAVSEDRAVLVMGVAAAWMVLFGHGVPSGLNPNVVMW